METLIIIGVAGFIGANVRYWLGTWAAGAFGTGFPWGTLIINFTGSVLLSIFVAWAAGRTNFDPRIRYFVAVGFFGAYTTFSTYAVDSVMLLRSAAWTSGLLNILATNGLCLIGVAIGLIIGSRL